MGRHDHSLLICHHPNVPHHAHPKFSRISYLIRPCAHAPHPPVCPTISPCCSFPRLLFVRVDILYLYITTARPHIGPHPKTHLMSQSRWRAVACSEPLISPPHLPVSSSLPPPPSLPDPPSPSLPFRGREGHCQITTLGMDQIPQNGAVTRGQGPGRAVVEGGLEAVED
jgi:hypothetical protein